MILTSNFANESLPHLVVDLVTSKVSREYPLDVPLPAGSCVLPESSRVQLNSIRGLNRSRSGRYLGSLTPVQISDLDGKLKVHLGLS